MTDEERDLHLVYLKMTAPHFHGTGSAYTQTFRADQYTVTTEEGGTWVLLAPDGGVVIRETTWYAIAIQINSSLGAFDTVQKVRDFKESIERFRTESK